MKILTPFLPFTLLLLLLAACGGGSDGGSDAPQQEEAPPTTTGGTAGGTTGGTSGGTTGGGNANFDVTLDSELNPSEKISLSNSIDKLEKLEIDGSKISGFVSIFKGSRSSNVVNYLESRINYVISESTNPYSRVLVPVSDLTMKLLGFASNESVFFWYIDKYFETAGGADFVINGRERPISSSRIGVMQLGSDFVGSDTITQAITIVHEARHSDCPNGAFRSDINNLVEQGDFFPENRTCGQLHSDFGFDTFAWGPYAIDYIYSLAISNTCSNCTNLEKDQAQFNANQVQQQAFEINETMNGVHGQPRMGNSTNVREDL